MSAARRLSANNRAVIAGFVGLLLLMAFAEFEGLRTLRQIQKTNDEMREGFLRRTRLLDRIRADLYLSGTYVRDYLLEPEPGKAESHLKSLIQSRSDMDAALQMYRGLLNTEDSKPFAFLTQELAGYWKVLEPVLEWTTPQRQRAGYIFLRDEVFPRRIAMLGIADQIGAIAESQLKVGKLRVEETYRGFRRLLAITIALTALTGVLVEMANLSTLIRKRETGALGSKADEIKKMVENSISVVRNMALLLRPPMLDDLGLIPALQWQAREVSKRTGVWVKVADENVSEDLPEELKTCVYRIVQEALHNCVQHSGARTVRVTIRQEPDRLFLSVQDDGKGFHAHQERGMGLLGIDERVTHLGGTFSVESEPGHGAVLRIILPQIVQPGPRVVV